MTGRASRPWPELLQRILGVLTRRDPPRVVQEALEPQYDQEVLDEYRRTGGGVASPDAAPITDDGTI